jgi:hypothetical protein
MAKECTWMHQRVEMCNFGAGGRRRSVHSGGVHRYAAESVDVYVLEQGGAGGRSIVEE